MGQTQLVYKVGWGCIVRFIGENLGKSKGLKYLIFFPLSQVFLLLLLWGFNGYKEWIIQLN